jgi:cell division protein FtsI (penicillin-binding protein 3)
MSKVNLTQQQLVHDRIRKVVAIALVILMLFSLRLIDLQAVRAAGFVERAQNELTKSGTLWNYLRY